uniref:C1q domain-containing protein n=1 Tax=Salarias fasciatus TaxID=181472 RepID=A0A672F743_SALFA
MRHTIRPALLLLPGNAEVYERDLLFSGVHGSVYSFCDPPLRGIYYFSFSGHNASSRPMGLQLMKNGRHMVTVYNHPAGNRFETATNGMVLQLEVGEQVYMSLMANTWILDNMNHHSTFTGFLLFPVRMMKTSVVIVALFLSGLCNAAVLKQDKQTKEKNSETAGKEGSDKQLDPQRSQLQGKIRCFCLISTGFSDICFKRTMFVRGIYYFSFSGHNISSKPMGLQLMKNGRHMVTVYNHPAGNRHETATNGMVLLLEVGEQVYMRLMANTWIFDNANQHSTFTGFLLFPV